MIHQYWFPTITTLNLTFILPLVIHYCFPTIFAFLYLTSLLYFLFCFILFLMIHQYWFPTITTLNLTFILSLVIHYCFPTIVFAFLYLTSLLYYFILFVLLYLTFILFFILFYIVFNNPSLLVSSWSHCYNFCHDVCRAIKNNSSNF